MEGPSAADKSHLDRMSGLRKSLLQIWQMNCSSASASSSSFFSPSPFCCFFSSQFCCFCLSSLRSVPFCFGCCCCCGIIWHLKAGTNGGDILPTISTDWRHGDDADKDADEKHRILNARSSNLCLISLRTFSPDTVFDGRAPPPVASGGTITNEEDDGTVAEAKDKEDDGEDDASVISCSEEGAGGRSECVSSCCRNCEAERTAANSHAKNSAGGVQLKRGGGMAIKSDQKQTDRCN